MGVEDDGWRPDRNRIAEDSEEQPDRVAHPDKTSPRRILGYVGRQTAAIVIGTAVTATALIGLGFVGLKGLETAANIDEANRNRAEAAWQELGFDVRARFMLDTYGRAVINSPDSVPNGDGTTTVTCDFPEQHPNLAQQALGIHDPSALSEQVGFPVDRVTFDVDTTRDDPTSLTFTAFDLAPEGDTVINRADVQIIEGQSTDGKRFYTMRLNQPGDPFAYNGRAEEEPNLPKRLTTAETLLDEGARACGLKLPE